MSKDFYADSCIWLNLFKKEESASNGIPHWKIAEEFIEKIMFSNNVIFYSKFVLKEIKFNLNNENLFQERLLFLIQEPRFNFVKETEEDYSFARQLESESYFEISFYDCMHIAICKRLNLILVTRDRLLLEFARDYISAEKPENLFFP